MSEFATFCRVCGKALSEEEKGPGVTVCMTCRAAEPPPPPPPPQPPQYAPPPPPPPGTPSPGLAFLLGLIPGVGAIYNGQYAKGLVHVFVLGLLASIADSPSTRNGAEALFAMLIMAWVAYMAFEAYHTANRRLRGEPVDEFSSLVQFRASSIATPVVLILIGVLFLLHNFNLLRIGEMARFWPLIPIAIGVYMLYQRLAADEAGRPEASHEHR
ncbi:MAG: DUF5668 domain-containing protein [Bryobacteraceae bacterium]